MNIETGKIEWFNDEKELKKAMIKYKGKMIEINQEDMTEKQKETGKVSLHDNRSTLGKLRIQEKIKCQNGNKRRKNKRSRKK